MQLEGFLLHELEHVEEAIIPRWREALSEAEEVNEVRGHAGDHRGRGSREAKHEEGGQTLGEDGVGIGLEADSGGVLGVDEGADPDLGDAAAHAVLLVLEGGVEGGQPRPVVEELLVLGLGLGDGLEEDDDVPELGREEGEVDAGGLLLLPLLRPGTEGLGEGGGSGEGLEGDGGG